MEQESGDQKPIHFHKKKLGTDTYISLMIILVIPSDS